MQYKYHFMNLFLWMKIVENNVLHLAYCNLTRSILFKINQSENLKNRSFNDLLTNIRIFTDFIITTLLYYISNSIGSTYRLFEKNYLIVPKV